MKIRNSINRNLEHNYNKGNSGFMCDNWVEKVINDAGLDSKKYLPAGNSYAKTCKEHIEAAKKEGSGFTTTLPTGDGAYALFMGDGHTNEKGEIFREHAALLLIENGNMTVWDNCSSNTPESGYNIDFTPVQRLSSTQINKFGYDSFYYKQIF